MKHLATVRPSLIRQLAVAAATAASCLAACIVMTGPAKASPAPRRPAAVASWVRLSGSPGYPAANPRTNTIYVPIQCATSFCAHNQASHVVDIVSAARCNVRNGSGCRVVATARVGSSPLAAEVDVRTDTVYVVNGSSNTVSVLNGARCNAMVTSGCGRPVATFPVGTFPVGVAINPATRTLYVANLASGTVSVINAVTCNARAKSGCHVLRTLKDSKGKGPAWMAINSATDTIYTANTNAQGVSNTVSVFDGTTCNAHAKSGCGRAPAMVNVGNGAYGLAINQATDTVYVSNSNDGTVSVLNGARCNGHVRSGCGLTPPTVTTGAGSNFLAADPALHTVFAVNSGDDTLSAINTRTCAATTASHCQNPAPSRPAGLDNSRGYLGFPNSATLMPATGSAYLVNVGGSDLLTVTSINSCNATRTSGCRQLAPSVPNHELFISADPSAHTIYAGSLTQPLIDVISTSTCHQGSIAGCAPVAEIPMGQPGANLGAIDEATHTLYASDENGTVAVIDTTSCNAEHTSGCAATPPAISIGAFPNPPVINTATQTLYVAYGANGNRVAVVNAATCNATDQAGCGQTPAVVDVAPGTSILGVSTARNTVYAVSSGHGFSGGGVSVINGSICDSTDHSGCGHLAATITVGSGPFGVLVDDHTHTVYVVNNANGDAPGTVSVINAATCNGTHTAGCHGHFPVMAVGRSPLNAALDASTGRLYVTDFSSADVAILNADACNATITVGCHAAPRLQAVVSQPLGLAISQGTVYVTSPFQFGDLSLFRRAQ